MNPPCAKCSKTVYPTEKLNCLDKSWHKGCFSCEACGMTLNMKNYKGYNKLPYCHAHYPTTKFTTVADTPENRRLAKNTKTQSQVEYQKQFIQEKGSKISVADDPETMRLKRNTQNQSAVQYTGQLQQREQSEQHRPNTEAGTVVRKGNIHVRQTDIESLPDPAMLPVTHHYQPPTSPDDYDPVHQFESAYSGPPGQNKQQVGSIFDQRPHVPTSPQSYGQQHKYRAIYDYMAADNDEVSFKEGDTVINWQHIDEGWMTGTIERTGQTGMLPSNYIWHKLCFKCETCGMLLNMKNYKGYNKRPYCNTHYPTTKFTAVADTPENLRLKNQTQNQSQLTYHAEHRKNLQQYTAVADTPENARLKKNTQQSSMAVYKSTAPPSSGYSAAPPPSSYSAARPSGYSAGPASDYSAAPPSSGRIEERQQYQPPMNDPPYQPPVQQQAPPAAAQPPPPPPASSGPQYIAMYDYTAADDDEVSFVESDIIIDVEVIDAGWMTGTVKRTGQNGMLPSNYVEPCP